MPASARHCAVLAAALACALAGAAGVAEVGPVTDKAAEIESMTASGDYHHAFAAKHKPVFQGD